MARIHTTVSKLNLEDVQAGPMKIPSLARPIVAVGLEIVAGPDRNGNRYFACEFIRCSDGARARGVLPVGRGTAEYLLGMIFPEGEFVFNSESLSLTDFQRVTKGWPMVSAMEDVELQWERWGVWEPGKGGE